ncbi:hypothetical protein GJU94_10240 [Brucella sp. 10RB9214]|uniref:hypothetical protein n=1 Tax=unclassified Brucella TaxID=2632610 RepID=UPI0012ADA60F|nr:MULTISPECIES: hypothetical protein [unclassified Brucella]MRN50212.1 hypothetical protein [Brucella sp. 10RB9214]
MIPPVVFIIELVPHRFIEHGLTFRNLAAENRAKSCFEAASGPADSLAPKRNYGLFSLIFPYDQPPTQTEADRKYIIIQTLILQQTENIQKTPFA